MTAEDFNEKYAEFLEEGHYGLDIHKPEVITFLDAIFGSTLRHVPGFTFSQIKVKHGDPRFYSSANVIMCDLVEIGIAHCMYSAGIESRREVEDG